MYKYMHIILLAHYYPFVDWGPAAEMPTLQQDTHNQRWPDVPHPLAYWCVCWYSKTMVLVCIDKLARLTVIWICDSRIGRRQCCLCVHSISTSMWNIDVCVNTGTFTHLFALSSLLQVRNLTLVTCAARALLLQATTTIISGATVAKSHTGDHVKHKQATHLLQIPQNLTFDSYFCIL